VTTTATASVDPATLVDLARYPLLRPDSDDYAKVVDQAQTGLRASGAAEIEGFIAPGALAALIADAEALAPRAHRSGGQGTAYLEFPDFSLPDGHPRLHFADYALGAVAYDITPRTSLLRMLYEWNPLKDLIEAVLDRGPIFRYADPFGALNLAVMGEGDCNGTSTRPILSCRWPSSRPRPVATSRWPRGSAAPMTSIMKRLRASSPVTVRASRRWP
jgi:hypothetical protein